MSIAWARAAGVTNARAPIALKTSQSVWSIASDAFWNYLRVDGWLDRSCHLAA
jgi:hypothetical protein